MNLLILMFHIQGENLAEEHTTYEVHVGPKPFKYCLTSPILSNPYSLGGCAIATYNPCLVSKLYSPPSLCIIVENYTELNVALYL